MNDVAIDSSALVAILEGEPEAEACLRAVLAADRRLLGAPTAVELSIVVARRRGEAGIVALEALLARLRIEVVAFEAQHVMLARDAWLRFGKGRHPAGLNLGDCFSYAMARGAGLPLLCKGDDFAHTDLDRVPLA